MALLEIFDNRKHKLQKKTKNTWTGKVYESRKQAYQALAASEGMDSAEKSGWSTLCKKYPGRFEDVTSGSIIGDAGLDCFASEYT